MSTLSIKSFPWESRDTSLILGMAELLAVLPLIWCPRHIERLSLSAFVCAVCNRFHRQIPTR